MGRVRSQHEATMRLLRLDRHAARPLLILAALLGPSGPRDAPAQGVEAVRARYTKHEFRIPMRDGVRLFTAVYVPKEDSRTYPILLTRTPYSVQPYGVDRVPNDLGP